MKENLEKKKVRKKEENVSELQGGEVAGPHHWFGNSGGGTEQSVSSKDTEAGWGWRNTELEHSVTHILATLKIRLHFLFRALPQCHW